MIRMKYMREELKIKFTTDLSTDQSGGASFQLRFPLMT